jgi:hypothetical protein
VAHLTYLGERQHVARSSRKLQIYRYLQKMWHVTWHIFCKLLINKWLQEVQSSKGACLVVIRAARELAWLLSMQQMSLPGCYQSSKGACLIVIAVGE